MNCSNCGEKLPFKAKVCRSCNTPVVISRSKRDKDRTGLSIASLVFGIIGIILLPTVIFSALAVLFGSMGLRSTKGNYAKAGLIIGMVCLLIAIILYCILSATTNFDNFTMFFFRSIYTK